MVGITTIARILGGRILNLDSDEYRIERVCELLFPKYWLEQESQTKGCEGRKNKDVMLDVSMRYQGESYTAFFLFLFSTMLPSASLLLVCADNHYCKLYTDISRFTCTSFIFILSSCYPIPLHSLPLFVLLTDVQIPIFIHKTSDPTWSIIANRCRHHSSSIQCSAIDHQ